mgnify:CR=1 FL=1
MCIRDSTTEEEIKILNEKFYNKEGVTNVLAFINNQETPESKEQLIGEIAICISQIEKEAKGFEHISSDQTLKNVQNDLSHFNYGLKVFDAYRPQRSVDHFVKWARNNDRKMKKIHYPDVKKRNLFKEGYIASKSGHSRGSTIDLTIIDKKTGIELDMGTIYDFFGKESWIDYDGVTDLQKQNRLLLQSVMKKFGFKPLKEEWWHFTLHNGPVPDSYFRVLIEELPNTAEMPISTEVSPTEEPTSTTVIVRGLQGLIVDAEEFQKCFTTMGNIVQCTQKPNGDITITYEERQVALHAVRHFTGGSLIGRPITIFMGCLLYTSPSPRDRG